MLYILRYRKRNKILNSDYRKYSDYRKHLLIKNNRNLKTLKKKDTKVKNISMNELKFSISLMDLFSYYKKKPSFV